jgi:hypothetical protein
MPKTISIKKIYHVPSFDQLWKPLLSILPESPPLVSGSNRPLQLDFEHQLKALVFFHLEEHDSAQHLLQVMEDDDFARDSIAPENGIKKSSLSEAINNRGLEQLLFVFTKLQAKARSILPTQFAGLGELVAIDGSLIEACLTMLWADYRNNSKKAKIHLGFDINRSIPRKLFLTNGKGDERPFVSQILEPGETGVLDRGYQHHYNFDRLQDEEKHFVCRIKNNTIKTCIEEFDISSDSIVFYDAKVLLGQPGAKQTKTKLRLVGYIVDGVKYWIATDRFDLTAEEIALIYQLRWEVEKFFKWWKRHLHVYHLIARSEYGLMVQILTGLITYLLLAIYCQKQHGEKVSIKRVRELRAKINNELARNTVVYQMYQAYEYNLRQFWCYANS